MNAKEGGKMAKFSGYVYSDKLKARRTQKKYSGQDMANRMGVKSKVTYYNIENGIVKRLLSAV